MTAPKKPEALRLVCRLEGARPPAPPLGLRAWSQDEDAAIAVLLDLDPQPPDRAQVDLAVTQLPDPRELPEGRLVAVLDARASAGGLFTRLFSGARAHVPVAVRATALLARGYANVTAEAGLVWGEATRPS